MKGVPPSVGNLWCGVCLERVSGRAKGVKSSHLEIRLGCCVMLAWRLGLSVPRPLPLRSGTGTAQRLCAGCGKE